MYAFFAFSYYLGYMYSYMIVHFLNHPYLIIIKFFIYKLNEKHYADNIEITFNFIQIHIGVVYV